MTPIVIVEESFILRTENYRIYHKEQHTLYNDDHSHSLETNMIAYLIENTLLIIFMVDLVYHLTSFACSFCLCWIPLSSSTHVWTLVSSLLFRQ